MSEARQKILKIAPVVTKLYSCQICDVHTFKTEEGLRLHKCGQQHRARQKLLLSRQVSQRGNVQDGAQPGAGVAEDFEQPEPAPYQTAPAADASAEAASDLSAPSDSQQKDIEADEDSHAENADLAGMHSFRAALDAVEPIAEPLDSDSDSEEPEAAVFLTSKHSHLTKIELLLLPVLVKLSSKLLEKTIRGLNQEPGEERFRWGSKEEFEDFLKDDQVRYIL